MTSSQWLWILPCVAAVAFVYSMVGHGGASGMLAVLSLTALAPREVATAALVLNLVVATLSFVAYHRADHFRARLTWPFLVGSMPCALLGASMRVSERVYFMAVGLVLVYAAILLIVRPSSPGAASSPPAPGVAAGIGAGIGVLSGVVGVGGGIFLSPVVILKRWADARQAAATSAVFIIGNSLAGLAGRLHTGIAMPPGFWLMAACGALGAIAGGQVGARSIPVAGLRRVLGVVLLMAAARLLTGAR